MDNDKVIIYNKSKDYKKYISLHSNNQEDIVILIQDCYKSKLPGFLGHHTYCKGITIHVDKLFIKQLMLNIEIAMSNKRIITNEMWVNEPTVYGYSQEYDIAICRYGKDSLEFTAYLNRGVDRKRCDYNDIILEAEDVRLFYKALRDIIR